MIDLAIGLALNAILALLALALGAVRRSGAIAGVAVGVAIWWGLGLSGWLLLVLLVVAGSALTRLRYDDKRARGAAEPREGRRGAREALAKTAVAALAALLAPFLPAGVAVPIFVGALAGAIADTAASEVGAAFHGRARDPLTLRPRPAGAPGAISPVGTAAGAIAALAMAMAAIAVGLLPRSAPAIAAVVAAACAASYVESCVGARLPAGAGRLQHDLRNLGLTAMAGLLAWLLESLA